MESKTMKVIEMGKLLGLKKTESYYLVHKGFFKTYMICGTMRIDKESFEKWYASQFHYKKVNGESPGSNHSHTMSIKEMTNLLGVCEDTVYFIIKKGWVETTYISGKRRVIKSSFYRWYKSQDHYKLRDGDN